MPAQRCPKLPVLRRIGPLAAALVCGLGTTAARADSSSWLYLGVGPSRISAADYASETRTSLQMETGLGTDPGDSVIFGSLFRVHTHFGGGTDLALLARGATHGFVNGDWGVALDAGPYRRWWTPESRGIVGNLVLGAPWGVTASVGAGFGDAESQSFSLTVGIDLLRLTVYRRSGESWWKNSFPAHRPEDEPR